MDNYNVGRAWERIAARLLLDQGLASRVCLTKGSRGPFDLLARLSDGSLACIQVKSRQGPSSVCLSWDAMRRLAVAAKKRKARALLLARLGDRWIWQDLTKERCARL